MVRHLGSALTDVTYVFDEPTIGLHAHDVQQMNALLQQLRDKGNTVLVVEHEPGRHGHRRPRRRHGPAAPARTAATIVYEGPFDGLASSGTLTGAHLDVRQELKREPTSARSRLDPDPERPAAQPAETFRSTCRSASSSR